MSPPDARGGLRREPSPLRLTTFKEKWSQRACEHPDIQARSWAFFYGADGELLVHIARMLENGLIGGLTESWHGTITWNDLAITTAGQPSYYISGTAAGFTNGEPLSFHVMDPVGHAQLAKLAREQYMAKYIPDGTTA